MQTQRVDWPVLVACLLNGNDGRERFRHQWLACCEVVEHPDSYLPVRCDERPPLLDHLSPADLEQHVLQAHADGSVVSKNIAKAWSAWRTTVTEVEAQNAQRLQTLAITLQTLADLFRKSSHPEQVSQRIAELGTLLERDWGLAVPMQGDIRTWSVRMTRRFDLLPAEWREL
jgi:hypothetical protein